MVANFGQNWGYSVLLTEIPSYLSKVAGLDIEKVFHDNICIIYNLIYVDFPLQSSYFATAPYLALFILGLIFGPIADWLVRKNILSPKNVRKLMNSIGTYFSI